MRKYRAPDPPRGGALFIAGELLEPLLERQGPAAEQRPPVGALGPQGAAEQICEGPARGLQITEAELGLEGQLQLVLLDGVFVDHLGAFMSAGVGPPRL